MVLQLTNPKAIEDQIQTMEALYEPDLSFWRYDADVAEVNSFRNAVDSIREVVALELRLAKQAVANLPQVDPASAYRKSIDEGLYVDNKRITDYFYHNGHGECGLEDGTRVHFHFYKEPEKAAQVLAYDMILSLVMGDVFVKPLGLVTDIEGGVYGIAQEHVDGVSLRVPDDLKEMGVNLRTFDQDYTDAFNYALRAARKLDIMDIPHGDLNPTNIRLTEDKGTIRVRVFDSNTVYEMAAAGVEFTEYDTNLIRDSQTLSESLLGRGWL